MREEREGTEVPERTEKDVPSCRGLGLGEPRNLGGGDHGGAEGVPKVGDRGARRGGGSKGDCGSEHAGGLEVLGTRQGKG